MLVFHKNCYTARFFAKVNIGATHHDELYFEDFEVIEKPRGK
jgi:hypothetical protein